METYLVFIVQAYEMRTADGQVMDVCHVELIDTTPDKAIKRAKKLIKKPFYRISDIIERHYAKP